MSVDTPEVYAGDTSTVRIDAAGRAAKAERERVATHRLTTEFGDRLPWFSDTIRAYEQQLLPEARYVRAVDKLLPKIVHLLNGGSALRRLGVSTEELAESFEQQHHDMAGYAGEFAEVMRLQGDLSRCVIDQFLEPGAVGSG